MHQRVPARERTSFSALYRRCAIGASWYLRVPARRDLMRFSIGRVELAWRRHFTRLMKSPVGDCGRGTASTSAGAGQEGVSGIRDKRNFSSDS